MLRNIACLILCMCCLPAQGQRIVDLSTERTARGGGYDIIAHNHSNRNYSVLINFTSHQGLTIPGGMPYLYDAPPGKNMLVTLRPVGGGSRTSLDFTYTIYPGCARTNVRDEINYLMPVAEGKSSEYRKLGYVNEQYGHENEPENWNGALFTMNKGDTVYAMRRGKVVELSDSRVNDEKRNLIFSRNLNYILVQHEDCTIGRYSALAKDGVQVVEGDFVEDGKPMMLQHEQTYTSSKPEEVIFSEMSKKEIKRYQSRQNE